MKVLSLCSGYGGLELALGILFPGRVDTIAVCDNYAPAQGALGVYRAITNPTND